eukprot:SM000050S16991  [mRNA]  locus=s50:256405:256931:+ [translate_table: standard]
MGPSPSDRWAPAPAVRAAAVAAVGGDGGGPIAPCRRRLARSLRPAHGRARPRGFLGCPVHGCAFRLFFPPMPSLLPLLLPHSSHSSSSRTGAARKVEEQQWQEGGRGWEGRPEVPMRALSTCP